MDTLLTYGQVNTLVQRWRWELVKNMVIQVVRDNSNDFHDRQGRIMDTLLTYGQVNTFVQRWRWEPVQ
jgi:hypothetical protein